MGREVGENLRGIEEGENDQKILYDEIFFFKIKKTTMLKLALWDDANKVYWFQNTSWQRLFLNLEPSYLQNAWVIVY